MVKPKYKLTTHPFLKRPNGKPKTCAVHVRIWCLYYNRCVPQGYEIHHDDGNQYNNSIENLICITIKKHRQLHLELRKKEFQERQKFRGW